MLGRLFAVAASLARDAGIARRRLPPRLERRALGRPDGRSPPRPPDGRPAVRLAARVRRQTGHRPGIVGRSRSLRRSSAVAGCGTCRRSRAVVPGRLDRAGDDRLAGRRPDAGRAGRACSVEHSLQLSRHPDARPDGRIARCSRPRRAPSTRWSCRRIRTRATSSSTSSPTRRGPRPPRPSSRPTSGAGPGRVQTPQGTVSVIRQVGSTVVMYQWLPGAAQDPSAPGIQDGARDARGRATRSRTDDRAARLRRRPGLRPTGSGDSTATQARTWVRLTLSVWVRGKSSSGHSRQPAIRWFGPSVALAAFTAASIRSRRPAGSSPPTAPGSPPPAADPRTIASIRPGRVSRTTESRIPAIRSAFSMSSG